MMPSLIQKLYCLLPLPAELLLLLDG